MKNIGKFGCLLTVVLLLVAVSLSVVNGLGNTPDTLTALPKAVPAAENLALEQNNALDARLGQLLRLNRAFDDSLSAPAALIDEASVILADQAEVIDGKNVLPMGLVLSFIHDLYGVTLDLSDLPAAYTATAPGYFDIMDRECAQMTSELLNTEILPDGHIQAKATLTLNGYMGETVVQTETVFVQNSGSAFGYNIVSASILCEDETPVGGYNMENPMDLIEIGYDSICLD